ncbi:MAG: hypothetical protein O7H41_13690 [Planctomycetota bacterium]|nr:hypothetical protein [Planctomycetota bacterium]
MERGKAGFLLGLMAGLALAFAMGAARPPAIVQPGEYTFVFKNWANNPFKVRTSK